MAGKLRDEAIPSKHTPNERLPACPAGRLRRKTPRNDNGVLIGQSPYRIYAQSSPSLLEEKGQGDEFRCFSHNL